MYEVEEYSVDSPATRSAFVERVSNEGVTQRSVGLVVRNMPTAFVIRTTDEAIRLIDHENAPDIVSRFDAEWVEKGILRRLSNHPNELARVETDLTEFPRAMSETSAGFGFVVNPPPKREVAQLAHRNWRLPIGSLIVRPAVPRGLLLCPLRPASHILPLS